MLDTPSVPGAVFFSYFTLVANSVGVMVSVAMVWETGLGCGKWKNRSCIVLAAQVGNTAGKFVWSKDGCVGTEWILERQFLKTSALLSLSVAKLPLTMRGERFVWVELSDQSPEVLGVVGPVILCFVTHKFKSENLV